MTHKLKALRELLHRQALAALLIENPVDLFYLTGIALSKGYLVVKEFDAVLFVDSRYLAAVRSQSLFPVELSEQGAFGKGLTGRVGFDSAYITCDRYSSLQKDFSSVEWVALSEPLKKIRVRKTPDELAALQRAAALTKRGISHIESLLKEGVSEEELAFEFEWFCRKQGASSLSFEPIVAFGEHSAYPHHRAGKALLQKDQVVLIDVGAIVDHYRGDITRVIFFGHPDPKILHLLDVTQRAQRTVLQAIRPGVPIGRLDEIAREVFAKEGLESYFTHSLGHGIGLETHEYPKLRFDGEDANVLLEPGMVFTVEPGLYQPGLGGVRYEDMVVVTQHGCELC